MKGIFLFSITALLFSCENNSTTHSTIEGNFNVISVNMTDENGNKQGEWVVEDTVTNRYLKEMHYRNGLLDGLYLEYKINSPDTLFRGSYKLGKRNGEWKFWSKDSNKIEKIETYENDTLKKVLTTND